MFAKNQKISHSQLYCQMVLTCAGIYLVCIPGWEGMLGRLGIWCLGIAAVVFLFYSIFLVRIGHVYSGIEKYFGKAGSVLISLPYLIFLLHSGVFLMLRLEEMIQVYLVDGVPAWIVETLTILVCYMGSAKGLQRRGRMAQASVPVLLGALLLMFILGISQVEYRYLEEMAALDVGTVISGSYSMFCVFIPLFLLPFTLKQVERPYSTNRTIKAAVWTLVGILSTSLILLQGTFGLRGAVEYRHPMIALMAGVGLPGGFMERMDVFWIIFLVFSLLFALGSVFFYTGEILDRVGGKRISFLMAVLVWLGTALLRERADILQYGQMLKYFYVPCFLLISIVAGIVGKRRKTA